MCPLSRCAECPSSALLLLLLLSLLLLPLLRLPLAPRRQKYIMRLFRLLLYIFQYTPNCRKSIYII
jgi:hypothetical protein